MNAVTHTPGPWTLVEHDRDFFVLPDGDDNGCITEIPNRGNGRNYDENQANARLIASAPDLLLLLKQAVARVEIANAEGNPILSAWLQDARAALAKAEGIL